MCRISDRQYLGQVLSSANGISCPVSFNIAIDIEKLQLYVNHQIPYLGWFNVYRKKISVMATYCFRMSSALEGKYQYSLRMTL